MPTRRAMLASIVAAAVALTSYPRGASAQTAVVASLPASVRMRFDTIFSGVPRYVLTASPNAVTADDRYWRVVTMAPLQQRAVLDATDLNGGHVDAHLSAWSAIDLAAPSADGRAAGDLAVAWARYRHGAWGVWAGRRFIPWGAPGGVHIDAVGAEVQLGSGLFLEVLAGRPVTPVYGSLLGAHPGFEGTTAAGGIRVAWVDAGRIAMSTSFLEHWSHGIPVRRVVQADLVATPLRWLDVRGSLAVDLLGLGVMQADLDASTWLARRVQLEAGYGHLDPALLIPRWSILSVFVTRTFDEARARAAWRIVPAVSVGVEAAAQHYDVPGRDASQDGPTWGSRVEIFVRITNSNRRLQFYAMASRRDDGVRPMSLVRAAVMFAVVREIFGAFEVAAALDNDDIFAQRTSWYTRISVQGPIVAGWRAGASLDAVRSPIAASEVRGLVHLTAFFDLHGRPK